MAIRDDAIGIAMTHEMVTDMIACRGYVDVDFDDVWTDWLVRRSEHRSDDDRAASL